MGLPVLRLSSSSTHAVTNTPAEPQAAFRSHSPVTTAFPVLTPGRLPHHPFRGLLSVHSHYGLHGRQVPYKTLYTRGFSRFVTSTAAPVATGRSESCRTGFAPAERQRLGTAHEKVWLIRLGLPGCPYPAGPVPRPMPTRGRNPRRHTLDQFERCEYQANAVVGTPLGTRVDQAFDVDLTQTLQSQGGSSAMP